MYPSLLTVSSTPTPLSSDLPSHAIAVKLILSNSAAAFQHDPFCDSQIFFFDFNGLNVRVTSSSNTLSCWVGPVSLLLLLFGPSGHGYVPNQLCSSDFFPPPFGPVEERSPTSGRFFPRFFFHQLPLLCCEVSCAVAELVAIPFWPFPFPPFP